MKFSKYLAGLAVVALVAAVVDAGPPRRSRRMHDSESATAWMGGSQVASAPILTTESTSPYSVPTAGPSASTEPATTTSSPSPSVVPASGVEAAPSGQDALAEVNATRAQRGLRPYLPDPLLNQAALACATQRATRMIQGHLPESDFSYLPAGAHASSAGCAAWTPDWGWGSCCTYDNYSYAGAAWVTGSDGRRYMHLFVR